jgi:hypothetical protein
MRRNQQYEAVSHHSTQRYPLREINPEASQYDYPTGNEEMEHPRISHPPLYRSMPAPEYHLIDTRSPSVISRLLHGWWTTEILAWLAAVISMAIIMYMLKRFDQKRQAEWPFIISVNAFLQVFTTIFRGAVLVPVAQGISQLKWTWFLNRTHSLNDFAIFDDASRGIWGSLHLIWNQKAK